MKLIKLSRIYYQIINIFLELKLNYIQFYREITLVLQ